MLFVNNELHNENTKIVRFRDPEARLEEGIKRIRDPEARLEEGIKRIRDRFLENKEWMDGEGYNCREYLKFYRGGRGKLFSN